MLQVLQGLRAGKSDLEALQGKASVDEGQSIGKHFNVLIFNGKNIIKLMDNFSGCLA